MTVRFLLPLTILLLLTLCNKKENKRKKLSQSHFLKDGNKRDSNVMKKKHRMNNLDVSLLPRIPKWIRNSVNMVTIILFIPPTPSLKPCCLSLIIYVFFISSFTKRKEKKISFSRVFPIKPYSISQSVSPFFLLPRKHFSLKPQIP